VWYVQQLSKYHALREEEVFPWAAIQQGMPYQGERVEYIVDYWGGGDVRVAEYVCNEYFKLPHEVRFATA
jgi:hypothetical protein